MNAKGVLFVLSAFLISASLAQGRTWRVEQDGSGDFDSIQPAVDGSAPGDTILIGPGRYSETTLYDPNAAKDFFPKPVMIAVTVDDLTILGVDSDQVYIAPDVTDSSPDGPMGIATYLWITKLVVKGLTIEDVYDGLYVCGQVEIAECRFRNSDKGIAYWDEDGMIVRSCHFENSYCGVSPMTASNVLIESCSFVANRKAVLNIGSTSVAVMNSVFTDNWIAIDYQQGASGSVQGCTATGEYAAIRLVDYSSIHLVDNALHGGLYCIVSTNNCDITAVANELLDGSDAVIALSRATATLHGNHILRSDGWSVWLPLYPDSPAVTLDMTGNYWGTTDGDQIAEWIFDGHDDPSIQAFVNYEPFEQQPIGTEPATLGRVKAMYR